MKRPASNLAMAGLELVLGALSTSCTALPFSSLLEIRGSSLLLRENIRSRLSGIGALDSKKRLRASSIALRLSKLIEPLRLCPELGRAFRAGSRS